MLCVLQDRHWREAQRRDGHRSRCEADCRYQQLLRREPPHSGVLPAVGGGEGRGRMGVCVQSGLSAGDRGKNRLYLQDTTGAFKALAVVVSKQCDQRSFRVSVRLAIYVCCFSAPRWSNLGREGYRDSPLLYRWRLAVSRGARGGT